MKDQLKAAMEEINQMNASHGVAMHGGKKYTQVSQRVEVFRKHFPDYSIVTKVKVDDKERVVVYAEIFAPGGERPIATGTAEEIRGSSKVNRTSAIENGETSSIGRALATLGLHGGEFASEFEMSNIKNKEKNIEEQKKTPKDPPKEDPEEAEITETLRDDSDFIRDSEDAQSGSEKELRRWANDFLYKEFDKAKSLPQLAAIFRQQQSGYVKIKNKFPKLAEEISKFYEVKEEQLRK
tara:strand:+ start:1935 stop:2648 length:714 start_codon:yes stop_codon:yes gene_type:complete